MRRSCANTVGPSYIRISYSRGRNCRSKPQRLARPPPTESEIQLANAILLLYVSWNPAIALQESPWGLSSVWSMVGYNSSDLAAGTQASLSVVAPDEHGEYRHG